MLEIVVLEALDEVSLKELDKENLNLCNSGAKQGFVGKPSTCILEATLTVSPKRQ